MTPGDNKVTSTCDVYFDSRLDKTGKNGPYFMYETSAGTLVCFDAAIAAKITSDPSLAWELLLADAKPPFKYRVVKGIVGSIVKPRVVPPPPITPPTYAVAAGNRPYVDKTDVFEAKDYRISKLSIFSSLVNLAAAKAGGDPEYAKKPFDDILLDIVERANMVTREYIYGGTKTDITSNIPATVQVVVPPATPPASTPTPATQHGTQATVTYSAPPTQTVTASPPTTVAKVTAPPATPPAPVSPSASPVTYIPPTDVPPVTPATTTTLFGGNSPDLEQRMAARLKELTSRGKR